MQKKTMFWKTRGMNRDMSVSAFNPEFSFENMNLRLSTNDGNTLMSWVNEKGTAELLDSDSDECWEKDGVVVTEEPSPATGWTHYEAGTYPLSLAGMAIGTAILNKYLVVFTTMNDDDSSYGTDRIYRIHRASGENGLSAKVLFRGSLNFCTTNPIETLVSYESEDLQKVYWVDGRNQPRVINIVASDAKIDKWQTSTGEPIASWFDFVPVIGYGSGNSETTMTVVNNGPSGGLFAPGVIQYCFSYFNKNGQQSNIVDVSPLYYLALTNRGASPEEKVSNSFTITIQHPDTNFEYIRLYSIQRTSLNLEPFVKRLDDVPIGDDGVITYVDNGTTGSSIDPTELLFIGGKEIIAGTIADKDGTLFLGNVQQVTAEPDVDERISAITPEFSLDKILSFKVNYGIYDYQNLLGKSLSEITTFKGGDTYRLGVQFQTETGEWTEPIHLKDVTNTLYPSTSISDSTATIRLVKATAGIPRSYISNYKRVRPVVVYPTIADRNVLCQGVLNPTVFNSVDRIDNAPFSQASWYFRPIIKTGERNPSQAIDASTLVSSSTDSGVPMVNDDQIQPYTLNQWLDSHGYYVGVYVLVAEVPNNAIADILSRGTLRATYWHNLLYTNETQDSNNQYELESRELDFSRYGAINLGAVGDNYTKYAFITDKKPEDSYNELRELTQFSYGYEGYSFVYEDGVRTARTSGSLFRISKSIRVDGSHLTFYTKPANDAPNTFDFYFNDAGYYYHYTFTSAGAESEFSVDTVKREGDGVRYKHYDPLFSTSDLGTGNIIEQSRQIEIQGSESLFSSVFVNRNFSVYKTNSEFFIDQSIVTLNSPDIEFDTDVQRYATENLKLRVIGAIPITATVSAVDIQTSSSMMELNHHGNNERTLFGRGKLNYQVLYNNSPSTNNGAGKRMVSHYLWNDALFQNDIDKDDKVTTKATPVDYLIYPWQRTGSLTNDTRTKDVASSWLRTKKESNLLFSEYTKYTSRTVDYNTSGTVDYTDIGIQMHLTENDEVMNYRLPGQSSSWPDINYYPNIDKIIYNEDGYSILNSSSAVMEQGKRECTSPVSMRYKSTSHAVISLNESSGFIPLLPYSDTYNRYTRRSIDTETNPFWSDKTMSFSQSSLTIDDAHNFLWLGEIYKTPSNQFGNVETNKWMIAGESVVIPSSGNVNVTVEWTEGDTYYQRYDCLKTYPFTEEDTNQLVEILSFMCETHVNIDGRYDRNRGQVDNTNMSPRNFNLLNPVYSQQDNFFTYRKLDSEGQESQNYPNQVYYSKTKNSGGDVDMWTNVTLASMLELDGDKGRLNKLTRFNDQLLAFQDTGISQILYNENTAISSTAGVPIEIANSGKVTGKRYLSDTIGCQNKWSMVNSPMGIYFMDSHDKSIYLFNGQLKNLSTELGMNSWCKQNIQSGVWNPTDWDGKFVGHYDRQNQDVLFVGSEDALAYSEKVGTFTSFYDYGQQGFFENLDGEGIWLTSSIDNATYQTRLWRHQGGEYGEFFGVKKPYWMTLVGNPEPQKDKVFTNLEMRACIVGDGVSSEGGSSEGVEMTSQHTGQEFGFYLPFDELEVWDEYQHGVAVFGEGSLRSRIHHPFVGDAGNLKRKFRIWRSDVPRDNFSYPEDEDEKAAVQAQEAEMGISRFKVRPLDRMRNPWVYLKLVKNAAGEGADEHLKKTEVHDVGLEYFV